MYDDYSGVLLCSGISWRFGGNPEDDRGNLYQITGMRQTCSGWTVLLHAGRFAASREFGKHTE